VASLLEGNFRINLTNRPGEDYLISLPNLYARGILIGTMIYEVSDPCKITCEKTGIVAEIEFKSKVCHAAFSSHPLFVNRAPSTLATQKGYFTGTYNALTGSVKKGGEELYKISGKWSDEMHLQSTKAKKQEVFFDATKAKVMKKTVPPETDQTEFESRRLAPPSLLGQYTFTSPFW